MILDKLVHSGWSIDKSGMMFIHQLISEQKLQRAIEFGSGQSTLLLEDSQIDYVSFDSDAKFSAKTDKVLIRNLKQLDDSTFNDVVNCKVSYMDVYKNFDEPTSVDTRTKNIFYEFLDQDLSGTFDLVILDGPNGNGRSISFNVMKPFLSKNSYIFVDDFWHYPFTDHLKICFPQAKLLQKSDDWVVFQIES